MMRDEPMPRSWYHWLGRDTDAILTEIETKQQAERDQATRVAVLCPVVSDEGEDG